MAQYENGAFTRRVVVDTFIRLFYENGFHETSYGDICRESHVNRSTLYYHFKDKEVMRYEAVWEYTAMDRKLIEKYCTSSENVLVQAMYLMWIQVKNDAKFRRFIYQACLDYPMYTGKMDYTHYYLMISENVFGTRQPSSLSIASAYGYIVGCLRMLCEKPDFYDPAELVSHCLNSCISIWNLSEEKNTMMWTELEYVQSCIPEKYKKTFCFDV